MSTKQKQTEPSVSSIFISYAREDLGSAERLRERLIGASFDAYLDKHDILPGEPWQERLGGLISAADNVVFLISGASLDSSMCDWEVNEAERLSKRIFPIVVSEVPDERVPGRLRRLNFLFMRTDYEWQSEVPRLVEAILVDVDWIREHSRIGQLAREWLDRGRPDELTLQGGALDRAEAWLVEHPKKAPEATALHREYIQTSRLDDFKRLSRKEAEISAALFKRAVISP